MRRAERERRNARAATRRCRVYSGALVEISAAWMNKGNERERREETERRKPEETTGVAITLLRISHLTLSLRATFIALTHVFFNALI